MQQTSLNRKSILARLLANENVTVQYGNFDMAGFDTKSRTLYLPYWEDASEDVHDLLVGHEVSHGINNPHDESVHTGDIPFSYFNIVEDVRIEKLILRRYPGLVGNFKRGYTELIKQRDFFGFKKHGPATDRTFMDRLNIHAKSRGLVDVPFTDEEMYWVREAEQTETYEEVVELTKRIALWLKYQQHKDENQVQITYTPSSDGQQQESGDSIQIEVQVEGASDRQSEEGDQPGQAGEQQSDDDDATNPCAELTDEQRQQVQDRMDDLVVEMRDLITAIGEDDDFDPNDYDLEEATTADAIERVQKSMVAQRRVYLDAFDRTMVRESTISYGEVLRERQMIADNHPRRASFPKMGYEKFKQEVKTVVGPMIKEFEMRKAAYRSARSRTAQRGTLDVNKLYRHKYDDQLFKQVTWFEDAKNHGMIVLVDHSGSMDLQMPAVRRQLLILATFCKRVGIPFEIYGFTTLLRGERDTASWQCDRFRRKMAYASTGDFLVDDTMLVELLSSRMNRQDYEKAFRQIFWMMKTKEAPCISKYDKLGGTPLNNAICSMRVKISEFRRKFSVEKMNLIVLTDGDNGGDANKVVISSSNGPADSFPSVIINVEGVRLKWMKGWTTRHETERAVKMIRDMDVRVINMHIVHMIDSVRDEMRTVRGISPLLGRCHKGDTYDKDLYNQDARALAADGMVSYDECIGYNRRMIMYSGTPGFSGTQTSISNASLEGASAKKAAAALTKSGKAKRTARIMAQKFCDVVA